MMTSTQIAEQITAHIPDYLERADQSATYSQIEFSRLAAGLRSIRIGEFGKRFVTFRHNRWTGDAGKMIALIDRATENLDLNSGQIDVVDATTTRFSW